MIFQYEKIRYDKLLEGGRALVTGGNGPIGRAIAKVFAMHGAQVAITDVNDEGVEAFVEELNALQSGCFFVKADFTCEQSVQSMLDEVLARLGSVTVLVNNAGYFTADLLENASLADADRMMQISYRGAVLCTQRCIPGMLENSRGNIVSVTTDYVDHAVPGISLFAASKAALQSFTRAVGFDYAKYDIRANCVMPGYNITSVGDYYHSTMSDERFEEHLRSGQPLQRRGTPEDVANAVLYFASPICRNITGECVPVNGGISVVAHKNTLMNPAE